MTVRNLDPLFHPRRVAVIGGSDRPGTLGEIILSRVLDGGFEGNVYAVNPKRVEMDDVWWVHAVDALPQAPDLAVIVTPAQTIPAIVADLGKLGTRVAVVISNTAQDPAIRQAILDAARPHLLRVVGPNCLGVLMPHARLNASFATRRAAPGGLAFISQSGALVTAMLDWAADKHLGFSTIVSVGDMADVDLADLIDMLAADAKTQAILLYVEGVTDAPKFMSAARAASRVKPVIAIKAGRTAAAGKAALSHTGALTGSYDVHATAFERAGIVLVDSLTELFDAAQVLCRRAPECGERLAIVSNGGGAGVLAADALPATGGRLASLSEETIARLDPEMPRGWSRANPLDVVGDARAARFAAATAAALADEGADALLVIHCPTAVELGVEIASGVAEAAAGTRKAVIACWMGPGNAAAARDVFDAAGIPMFDNVDDAVRGYGHLLAATRARRALMRAPASVTVGESDRCRAVAAIAGARRADRDTLTATETKAILAAYGIPVLAHRFARTPEAVAEACAGLEGPWVVKLVSPQLSHKSDVGGVALGLATPADARAAAAAMLDRIRHQHRGVEILGFEVEPMARIGQGQELLLGIATDPVFGPVLAFGAGGKAVEVLADRALGLPPLDDALAGAMIDRTRVSKLLAGYRDVPPANREAIVRALNALSAIAIDFPAIAELDVNPLVATPEGVIALDARARLAPATAESRLAIRPYPAEWEQELTTRSGVKLQVRPVRPDDEAALADFFHHVSPEDLRFRFLTGVREVSRERLVAMTQIDYRRTVHFLAFAGDTLAASALLAADPDRVRAELAISVRSDFRGQGVSWTLVELIMRYAEATGIEIVESIESSENHAALALEREAGFVVTTDPEYPTEMRVRRRVRRSDAA